MSRLGWSNVGGDETGTPRQLQRPGRSSSVNPMLIDAAPGRWSRALLLVVLATALWGGCSPDDFLVADEDRERNFQRARDAERLGEFDAASEYYERALERNGR